MVTRLDVANGPQTVVLRLPVTSVLSPRLAAKRPQQTEGR
jgi:hypothetical protein